MQPLPLIVDTLKAWEKVFYNHLNIAHTSEAIGWSWLMSSFSETKISHKSLLPVLQEESTVQLKDGYNSPTEETIKILKRLVQADKIPRKVLQNLAIIGLIKYL